MPDPDTVLRKTDFVTMLSIMLSYLVALLISKEITDVVHNIEHAMKC